MNSEKNGFARRFTASLVLALFMSQVSLPMWGTNRAWADVGTNVKAPLKNYPDNVDVGMEETDDRSGGTRKSNVLFLIEATAAMSFTPKGVVPQVRKFNDWDWSSNENANWQLTKEDYGFTIYDINRMMVDATFGMGAMPPAWTNRDLRPERNLYGRERNENNNFKKQSSLAEDIQVNSQDYYFPFTTADNPLTDGYKAQTTALETHFTNAQDAWPDELRLNTLHTGSNYSDYQMASTAWYDPGYKSSILRVPESGTPIIVAGNTEGKRNIAIFGDEQLAYANAYKNSTSTKKPYPYALVYKNPAWWASGPPPGTPVKSEDLVPNDSRMYQTKLVLWRLLSDRELFKNIRFGMATTFLSPANVEYPIKNGTHYGIERPRQDWNYIFKVWPFGANLRTKNYFDSNGNPQINAPDVNYTVYGPSGSHGLTDIRPNAGFHRVRYENGVLNGATTGEIQVFVSVHGQYIPIWYNAVVHSNYMTRMANGNEPDGWYQGVVQGPTANPSAGDNADRPMYKVMNRASLWLPITEHDHSWQKGGKSIDHVEKFKMWINGFADIRSAGTPDSQNETVNTESRTSGTTSGLTGADRDNQFHYYKDPEIGVAGIFALAQAIFPDPTKVHSATGKSLELDRKYYYDRKWIWYSKKDKNINYRADYRRLSNELEMSGVARARFNAGSGEATGSVLDFFSPIIDYEIEGSDSAAESYPSVSANTYRFVAIRDSGSGSPASDRNKVKIAELDDLSFPIRSTCEDNWLIVVASGTEPKVKSSAEYSYGAWEAVKNLYDSTDAAQSQDQTLTTGPRKAAYEQSTMITKTSGGRTLSKVDLENPIRTLVIGIVANEDDPEVKDNPSVLKEVKRMRLNLIKMANAGRGEDPSGYTEANMYTAPYQPFFASNSTELLEAFRDALTAVNKSDATQPSRGSLFDTPVAGEDLPSMFSTSYRIVQGDQWEGHLTRYTVSDDEDGSSTLTEKWEFDDILRARRDNGAVRKLKYWGGSNFTLISEGDSAFNNLLGANSRIGAGLLPGATFGAVTPDKALYYWLQGYEYSYNSNEKIPRSSMLADFGNSGVIYADYPSVTNNGLSGYYEWAENLKSTVTPDTERLYAQTNDGILHVIVPSSGEEESAILPPPTLLPSRLASLKTNKADNLYKITGNEKALGTRSNPGFTLDGPLQKRRFGLSTGTDGMAGTDWRTLLLGTLGRGGNGLYMLDITYPDSPKFLWYKENLGDSVASMAAAQSEPVITLAADADPHYLKLGFNSPKPAMGIAGTMGGVQTNFIALPGGSQTSYEPAQNGKEGAVLLLIDPKDGKVIRAFDSAAAGNSTAKTGSVMEGLAPYMGMMVSQPTLLRSLPDSNSYMAGRVFAADNRGNIFMVSMEEQGSDGATTIHSPAGWKIRTVATLQKDTTAANNLSLSYAMPYGLSAGYVNKKIWLGGGTSNVLTKKSPAALDGEIKNYFQMIFGLRVPDDQNNAITHVRDDLKVFTVPSEDKIGPGDTHPGWYFRLRSEEQNDGEEYVSAKPVMVNGVMFIATFRETTRIDTSNSDPCGITRSVAGESRIYAVDIRTGGAGHWTGGVKWITIKDVKVVEMTLRRNSNNEYIIDINVDNFTGEDPEPTTPEPNLTVITKNLLRARGLGGGGGGSFPPEKSIILYWLSE
jgi:hypothetical protein